MWSNQGWLDQVVEQPLDPARRICDAHHHFWLRSPRREDYVLADLEADIASGHNVVSTVFVETHSMYRATGPEAFRPVGETEFVRGLAPMSASGAYGTTRAAAAIVGHADLRLGRDVAPVLEAHLAAAPKQFRGIRFSIADDPEIYPLVPTAGTRLDDRVVREGVSELERHGLLFETWLFHHQIPQLTALARAFPTLTIVLDHLGWPIGIRSYARRADEVFGEWRRNIDEIAREPNVFVKLGGMNSPMNGYGWHRRERPPTSEDIAAATGHFFLYAIEQFGAARCMFESNFPPERLSCSYGVLWNAFKRMVAVASEGERDLLFHDTAARVYRIGS